MNGQFYGLSTIAYYFIDLLRELENDGRLIMFAKVVGTVLSDAIFAKTAVASGEPFIACADTEAGHSL